MTRRGRLGLFVLAVAAAGVAVALGFWQGGRLAERRSANAHAMERRGMPEVDLATAHDAALDQRRAVVSGRYDHDRTLILRGRVEREAPGVFVVTPLLPDGGGPAVLVNRGFVPADDALRPDSALIGQPERAAVRGLAYALVSAPDSGGPLVTGGVTTWRRLDAAVAHRLPYAVAPVWLWQLPDSIRPDAPFPMPVEPPPLDDGPHLSYMVQWFGIALAALAFGLLFVLRPPARPDVPDGTL